MIRATTNGVLKSYRNNLMGSFASLNHARNTVLTKRNFNSYAEDPAAAAQAFQLRRAFLRTDSQCTISSSVIRKYESAYSTLENVINSVDNSQKGSAWQAVLASINDSTGNGRAPLGTELKQLSESIVQSMNSKYGETFTFAGADGLNVPFSWEKGQLCYRGIAVDDPANQAKLEELTGEKNFLDVGLGLQENASGELIESSAFNSAMHGIDFLGYGLDNDNDPKNIASIIYKMGSLLSNCGEDGQWANLDDGETYNRLAGKLEKVTTVLKEKHVELTAQASFLKDNHEQLEATADTLNEQILGIEQCDLADAITSFSWAQYCYNAALKMGNSILSQSLMDYLN